MSYYATKYFIAAVIFFYSNLPELSNDSVTITNSKKKTILLSDTTHNCMVVTFSNTIYKKVNLSGLKDSSVNILDKDYSHELLIDSIKSITFYGRGFWTGAVIGWSVGMLLGIISGGNIYHGSDGPSPDYSLGAGLGIGLVAGVPLGLIGGGLGALFAEDNFYDFSKLDLPSKRKKLLRLMREHADN